MNGIPDPFSEKPSSFYAAIFNTGTRTDISLPDKDKLNTLSTISGLYLYVNPPPHGTGTPAPKVAETVLRALKFNLKTQNKTGTIDGFTVDNPTWTEGTGFPYHEIASNFEPGALHEMTKEFLKVNKETITTTADKVISKMCTVNSDVLTKGKQTWCPFEERSLPCAQAYINFCAFLTKNGMPSHHTVVELIQYFFQLMGKSTIHTRQVEYSYVNKRRWVDGQQIVTSHRTRKSVEVTLQDEDAFRHMQDIARSFCSYIKHGERGHKDRRAIASPGILKRALFLVMEEFHLEIGKVIKGSTISIGGELKKIKIATVTGECRGDGNATYAYQATQDATKWNECLSPMGFGMMTKTMFDQDVRDAFCMGEMSPAEKLLGALGMASHWILAIKMITLGSGLQGLSVNFHGEIPYEEENISKFNSRTQEWVREIMPLRYGNNYIHAPGGMLMGMHNALSTTYGLLCVGFDKPIFGNIYTLRSSDDSMTVYTGDTMETLTSLLGGEKVNLKMCGINLSDKKTFVFKLGYGEYTSWYQDGPLVSQYGAETTRIRPAGMNPPDDAYTVAKSTSISLQNLESNNLGAEVKIRLGIENVRSLYRIKIRDDPSDVISSTVRVIADGGLNPWNSTNCHLDETCIKERFALTEPEREYFLKIRNPNNPFSGPPAEEVTWSKDVGALTIERTDNPRTVFHYVKRANATVKNKQGATHHIMEKHNARALEIMTMADPTLLLRIPASSYKMLAHVNSCFQTSISGINWTQSELELINSALEVLRTGRAHEEADDEDFQLDDNI